MQPQYSDDDCWDGINDGSYMGKVATTITGKTCKKWTDANAPRRKKNMRFSCTF